MASAIEDVSSLPGETVNDQDGRKIGQVKEIFAVGDDETPMWVTIEASTGIGRARRIFVPLARIKRQGDEIRVPYSYSHVHDSPEVEAEDELSEEDERALRGYYAIGLADQELVGAAQSYASQVPDEDGPARRIDPSAAEGPVRAIDEKPPAERAAEAYEKQRQEEGEEEQRSPRKATADELFDDEEGEQGSAAEGREKGSVESRGNTSDADSAEKGSAADGDEKSDEG
jgi:sporulation protein YlmC with PRC-barrel domain